MEELFTDRVSPEVLEKVINIVLFFSSYTKGVLSLQQLHRRDIAQLDDRFYTLCATYDDKVGSLAEKVGELEPNVLTVGQAYDILFTVKETAPFIIEFDNYTAEMGYPLSLSLDGVTMEEFLQELTNL